MLNKTLTLAAFFLLALAGCKKNKRPPLITTYVVTDITESNASCGGVLYSEGDGSVTEKGLCWGDANDPTVDDHKLVCGSGAGSFAGTLQDLAPQHSYYLRAYAINAAGIAYGRSMPFQTTLSYNPNLSTLDPDAINLTSATLHASISSYYAILENGFCYGTSAYPKTSGPKAVAPISQGTTFTRALTGLSPNTTYHVRAYMVTSQGTSYGKDVTFTTYNSTVSDADGNVYLTVKIGDQEWMAQNLRATRYSDAVSMANAAIDSDWSNTNTGAYCFFGNQSANTVNDGYLYNWYAATSAHNLAPAGWRIPTDDDWTQLINFCGGSSQAAIALKTKGYADWYSSGNGSNTFNFSALPSGLRDGNGSFSQHGLSCFFWSRTDNASLTTASAFNLYTTCYLYSFGKKWGLSIRCIKN